MRTASAALCLGLTLALAAAFPAPAGAGGSEAIFGEWVTPAEGRVRIGPCGEAPCGLLVGFPPPPGHTVRTTRDVNNRDRSRRDRPLLGIRVLWNLAGDGETWRGRAYDPRRGISAPVTARLAPGGELRLRGCIRVVVELCETEVWRRAN